MQLYSDKVENQTEKLADAVGDFDTEFTNQLVAENETVCDKAIKCIPRLKQFEETMSMKKVKKADAKEKYGTGLRPIYVIFFEFLPIGFQMKINDDMRLWLKQG